MITLILVMIRALHSFDVKQKRVLMRVDFNVPIENDRVVDSFRIRSAIPSIKECLESDTSLVLMSHLGRPNGKIDEKYSLVPVGEALSDILEIPIKFSYDCISEDAINVTIGLHPGEIHLLENLRFHSGETNNDHKLCLWNSPQIPCFQCWCYGTFYRKRYGIFNGKRDPVFTGKV